MTVGGCWIHECNFWRRIAQKIRIYSYVFISICFHVKLNCKLFTSDLDKRLIFSLRKWNIRTKKLRALGGKGGGWCWKRYCGVLLLAEYIMQFRLRRIAWKIHLCLYVFISFCLRAQFECKLFTPDFDKILLSQIK